LNSTTIASTVAQGLRDRILTQVSRVVATEDEVIETLLISMFAGGHALIEGIPGIGKTLLARTMARCVDCDFQRIQFTNDLMPSDIVGTAVWRQSTERFTFSKGPLFSNIVLADEINRTSPRTLSCLLEAMEEGKVSLERKTVELGNPFMVWATRNPIEFHGTYPIPEAALDRFLVRVELTYPNRELEESLYQGHRPEDTLQEIEPVIEREQLIQMIAAVRNILVSDPVASFCYRVVHATRHHDGVALGASPRAALAWLSVGKARALLHNRTAVLPDDLIATARCVLSHRIFLEGSGNAEEVVADILAKTPVDL